MLKLLFLRTSNKTLALVSVIYSLRTEATTLLKMRLERHTHKLAIRTSGDVEREWIVGAAVVD